ncbi:MAG TPA: IPT/TIG domain-containing protein, partial [Flavisolibacter sp.]|nr:IPT/TIG domain-containing protein [Flavisolibacter sp.]
MKTTSLSIFSFVFVLLALVTSCKKDRPDAPDKPIPATPATPAITSFTPTEGPVGAAVEIRGANFSTDPSKVSVSFNGKVAEVVSSTASAITTKVPANATSGKVSVTVNGKTATSASDF